MNIPLLIHNSRYNFSTHKKQRIFNKNILPSICCSCKLSSTFSSTINNPVSHTFPLFAHDCSNTPATSSLYHPFGFPLNLLEEVTHVGEDEPISIALDNFQAEITSTTFSGVLVTNFQLGNLNNRSMFTRVGKDEESRGPALPALSRVHTT